MATEQVTETDKKERIEVETILAQMRPLYRELADASSRVVALGSKLRSFETQITTLLNWQEGYEKRAKAADARLALAEQSARTRLSTIEHGHKTLVDDLSRKQIAADKAKAEAEAIAKKALDDRAEALALKDHYERLIAQVNATPAAKKSK